MYGSGRQAVISLSELRRPPDEAMQLAKLLDGRSTNMKRKHAVLSTFAVLALALVSNGLVGCTEDQVGAVLTGVQVAADELNADDDVSFRDWLSSELDD
jgi:hypothetical protein